MTAPAGAEGGNDGSFEMKNASKKADIHSTIYSAP